MLFYFSTTGNTKHVAEKIKEPQEEMISIEEACKAESYAYTVRDGRFGILSPTYAWGLPSIVYAFLEKLKLQYETKPYSFYVGTFGTTTGAASSIADSLLKEKGLDLDAKFDIRMPDTWTVIFDLSNAEKLKTSLKQAEEEINELKVLLSEKKKGKEMDFTVPEFVGRVAKKIYDGKMRKTKNLSVSDACIGCTLCAKKCPVQAIEMQNKKPVWVKEDCTMCLGCLHRCPKHAIYYGNGKATNAHGQYTYQKYAGEKSV